MNKQLVRISSSTILIFLLFLVATYLTEGADAVAYPANRSSLESAANPDSFVSGINQYGFQALSKLDDGGNVMISPVSLGVSLLMARSGAEGNTSDEIRDSLCMSSLSDEDILSSCQQIMWRVNLGGMENANSLWIQEGNTLSNSFIDTCNTNFRSDIYEVDFAHESAAAYDEIDQWLRSDSLESTSIVDEGTQGYIMSLAWRIHDRLAGEAPSDDTQLVIANKMYFLGDWEYPFCDYATNERIFYGTDSEQTVPFMHMTEDLSYMAASTYHMVSLPFEDSTYAMAIILPYDDENCEETIDELTENGFSNACKELSTREVILSLPRFDFSFDASMEEVMKSLGMNLAFDENDAQFDGITGSENDLYISDILHECSICVDEEGAIASATTKELIMSKSAERNLTAVYFTADHPFIFAIYDETDSTIVFLGIVGQL